jgi:hypothetical protein
MISKVNESTMFFLPASIAATSTSFQIRRTNNAKSQPRNIIRAMTDATRWYGAMNIEKFAAKWIANLFHDLSDPTATKQQSNAANQENDKADLVLLARDMVHSSCQRQNLDASLWLVGRTSTFSFPVLGRLKKLCEQ